MVVGLVLLLTAQSRRLIACGFFCCLQILALGAYRSKPLFDIAIRRRHSIELCVAE